MKKALGVALACLVLALVLTVAAGTGILGRVMEQWQLSAATSSASASAVPSFAPTPVLTATPEATVDIREALTYFSAVAFTTEYGGSAGDEGHIRKWEDPILIAVSGNPTDEDLRVLDRHIADLNAVPGIPEIRRVRTGGNVEIHFVPLSGMALAIPGYVAGNWGFFRVWWTDGLAIEKAEVGIATDVTTQTQRSHLILEEVTQMLGLMQDTDSHEDSIFYGPWTEVQTLSDLDWQVVSMLYRTDLAAGMSREAVMQILDDR